MKLIVGLGNPGSEYKASRHNVGFEVVELLAERWRLEFKRRKFDARFAAGMMGQEQVVLLKPQTYMNLSGQSVEQALAFYKVNIGDVLVVSDEMALSLGQIRLRQGGSAGGHNGLKDIISRCGSDFVRLRIGIGQSGFGDSVNHVLGRFDAEELPVIAASVQRAAQAIEMWLESSLRDTMNKYNAADSE